MKSPATVKPAAELPDGVSIHNFFEILVKPALLPKAGFLFLCAAHASCHDFQKNYAIAGIFVEKVCCN
jgi:hypothetical protein